MTPLVTGTRPARILVVDDDPTILRLLEFQLCRAGYNVAIAYKGSVALDRARSFDPDAILLDLHLPDVSGVEVLKQLRSDESQRPRIIVVLSATPNYGLLLQVGGADSVESKPIAPSTLLKRLQSLHVPPRIESQAESTSNAYAV
jgi:two-component system alkaline phosphatase synthesis response regulator PhoP